MMLRSYPFFFFYYFDECARRFYLAGVYLRWGWIITVYI